MNWNEDKSVRLSKVCVWIFALLLVAACVALPFVLPVWAWGRTGLLSVFSHRLTLRELRLCLLAVEYPTGLIAAVALWKLYRLLANIGAAQVFVPQNVSILRALSWCCIAAGLVLLAGAVFFWVPFILLSAAAAFVGLILRVVKNVFAEAVRIKAENDFTI